MFFQKWYFTALSVKGFILGNLKKKNLNDMSESFAGLLTVIKEDQEINARVIQLLRMRSFRWRSLLNKWLEQLRLKQAPFKLIQSLSCLFDDTLAANTLNLIENRKLDNGQDHHI